MQKWEYKFLITLHEIESKTMENIPTFQAGGWNNWLEDFDQLPPPVHFVTKFKELGEAGCLNRSNRTVKTVGWRTAGKQSALAR